MSGLFNENQVMTEEQYKEISKWGCFWFHNGGETKALFLMNSSLYVDHETSSNDRSCRLVCSSCPFCNNADVSLSLKTLDSVRSMTDREISFVVIMFHYLAGHLRRKIDLERNAAMLSYNDCATDRVWRMSFIDSSPSSTRQYYLLFESDLHIEEDVISNGRRRDCASS